MPMRIEGSLAHAGGPFLFQPTRAVSVAAWATARVRPYKLRRYVLRTTR